MRRRRGGGLVVVLIVLALIGAGVYYFYVHKSGQEDEEGASHGAVEQAAAQAGQAVEDHPAAGQDLKTDQGRAVMKERIEANMKAQHERRMKNIPK